MSTSTLPSLHLRHSHALLELNLQEEVGDPTLGKLLKLLSALLPAAHACIFLLTTFPLLHARTFCMPRTHALLPVSVPPSLFASLFISNFCTAHCTACHACALFAGKSSSGMVGFGVEGEAGYLQAVSSMPEFRITKQGGAYLPYPP